MVAIPYVDKQLTRNLFFLLNEKFSSCRFALEVRHKSWITDELSSLLDQYGIAFVIAESGKEVWPFFNNDYHGYAIKNAEQLKNIILSQVPC